MKNKKIYFIVTVAVLIVSISSVSYALWSAKFTQTSTNNIQTGCFDLSFESNDTGINLSNSYPISDAAGKKLEGYSFTVKNTCTIAASYNIALDLKTGSNYFNENQIKIFVENDKVINPTLLSGFSSSSVLSEGYNNSRILFSDILPAASSENGNDGGSKTYTLKIWVDESVTVDNGSNKRFEGKVTINGTAYNKNNLAQRIISENQIIAITPDFSKGEPPASGTNTGSGLYQANDDDGVSYYFRGAITNNYVKFANKIWKVVRINGDGTVRLISKETIGSSVYNNYRSSDVQECGEDVPCHKYVGYTYDNNHICTKENPCENNSGTNSDIKTYIDSWYKNNLAQYDAKIAISNYCDDTTNDASATTDEFAQRKYGAYIRAKNNTPTFKCPNTSENFGGLYKLKIGLLSADELNMIGYPYGALITKNKVGTSHYLYSENTWWISSPNLSNGWLASVSANSVDRIENTDPSFSLDVYPVINLAATTKIAGGNGTEASPFIVQ